MADYPFGDQIFLSRKAAMRKVSRLFSALVIAMLGMAPGPSAALCADPNLLLCDDFEGTTSEPNPALWSLELGEGSAIVIDDSVAASGSNSARVTVTQGRKWAYLQNTSIFPEAANGFWGRMFFRIRDARPATEGLVHWNLIEGMAETQPIKMYRYGGISVPQLGRNYFNWNFEMRPRPDGFDELSKDGSFDEVIPTGTWICVEWMFDAESDETRFFRDGEENPELHISGDLEGIPVDVLPLRALNLGFTIYQPIEAEFVVWIDDVAIHSKRIGCQP